MKILITPPNQPEKKSQETLKSHKRQLSSRDKKKPSKIGRLYA